MRIEIPLLIVLLFLVYLGTSMLFPTIKPEVKLDKFSSYDELKNFLKENSAGGYYRGGILTATAGIGGPEMLAAKTSDTTGSQDYSSTNIQVAGVDEADIVKNDGKYIYTVSGNKIVIIDAYPAEDAKIVSTIELDGTPSEIFVNHDKLVVFGNKYDYYPYYPYPVPLVGGTVVGAEIMRIPYYRYSPKTFAYVYDVSNRERPALSRNVTVIGNYVDSRMIGDYVYVVINSPIDDLENVTLPVMISNGEVKVTSASEISYFKEPDYYYQFTNIISINTQNDQEDLSNKIILMGTSENIFVSLDNIYITYQRVFNELDYTDKILDDAVLPYVPLSVAAEVENIRNSNLEKYEKFDKISGVLDDYLQTLNDDQRADLERNVEGKMADVQIEIQKEIQKTIIHRISIQNGGIEYKAKGEVPGYVLNQFSMDEHNGYFRIATTTSNFGGFQTFAVAQPVVEERTMTVDTKDIDMSEASSKPMMVEPRPRPTTLNHIYVLDSDLKIVGKVEDLAPGESIYSARFLGNRAYLVTFKSIDPLFVVDLSDPTNPKVLGKLKIPGYSDYLHPYDENHIIGIGKEVDESIDADKVHSPDAVYYTAVGGVKLSLFDVSDVSNPKEIAKLAIGDAGTDSEALRDHKAFLFSKEKNLLVIPILLNEKILPEQFGRYVWQGAFVFDVSLESGFKLKGKITHVPDGEKTGYYFFSPFSVKRSLHIDGVLYTVSDKLLKANSLDDLRKISEIELPGQQFEVMPLIK